MAGEDENPYTRPVRPGEASSVPPAPYVPPADAVSRGPGAEPPSEGPKRRSRTLPLLVAVLALAGFGAIVWYAYTWGTGEVPPSELPVVSAERDLTTVKKEPEEPGGMEVPHQDAEVLNERAGEQPAAQDGGVERLLPRAEAPQPPEPAPEPETATAERQAAEGAVSPESEASSGGELPDAPPAPPEVSPPLSDAAPSEEGGEATGTEAPAAVEVAESPVVAPSEAESGGAADTAPDTTPDTAPGTAPEQAAAEPETEPAAEQPASEPATQQNVPQQTGAQQTAAQQTAALPSSAEVQSGDWVLQLAALREMPAVEAEWGRLQSAHPDLLGSLKLATQSVETDNGTFIRLQAGPLPNRATAEDLCGLLQAQGTDCLIKRH